MALDAITGSVYNDPVNTRYQTNDNSATNLDINITETPVTVKSSDSNQATGEQDKGQNDGKATDQQIKDAIDKANHTMKAHRTRCEFSYHEKTNRVSIKVVDEETKKVIREIPPEETLKMVEKMWEIAGILVDEKR